MKASRRTGGARRRAAVFTAGLSLLVGSLAVEPATPGGGKPDPLAELEKEKEELEKEIANQVGGVPPSGQVDPCRGGVVLLGIEHARVEGGDPLGALRADHPLATAASKLDSDPANQALMRETSERRSERDRLGEQSERLERALEKQTAEVDRLAQRIAQTSNEDERGRLANALREAQAKRERLRSEHEKVRGQFMASDARFRTAQNQLQTRYGVPRSRLTEQAQTIARAYNC